MKRLLLYLLFLSPIFSEAQTSVYHPFPDSNAVWNIGVGQDVYCAPSMYTSYVSWSYILNGDSVINSQSYHKVYIPVYYFQYSDPCYTNHYSPYGYAACYRQDTAARKVYYIPQYDSLEHLLYDFTLQVGDTVSDIWFPPCFDTFWRTVTGIDSVLIGSTYRKRWIFPFASIIEGIGSTKGLLEPICPITNFVYNLVCFKQNGITLYPNVSSGCDVITSTDNGSEEKKLFSISPNPAHDVLNVECKMQNVELRIYDIMGRMVMEEKIHSPLSTFNFQLSPALYFVELSEIPQGGIRVRRHVQKLVVE